MNETKQMLQAILEIEARNTAEIHELQKMQENAVKELKKNQKVIYDDLLELKADTRVRRGCGEVKESAYPIYLHSV